ncbi:MAG: hypothetical protein P4M08_12375, partial [Oligoflexia bacterium]|nr:hypothetical protein [Oligoflexia bacterium]
MMTESKQQMNPIQVYYPPDADTYQCTMVVNIGFAMGQGKSYGIAISEIKKSKVFVSQTSFSEMIETVYEKLVEYGSNERGFSLILEAPLSAHFCDGWPAARVFYVDGDRVTERQA